MAMQIKIDFVFAADIAVLHSFCLPRRQQDRQISSRFSVNIQSSVFVLFSCC